MQHWKSMLVFQVQLVDKVQTSHLLAPVSDSHWKLTHRSQQHERSSTIKMSLSHKQQPKQQEKQLAMSTSHLALFSFSSFSASF